MTDPLVTVLVCTKDRPELLRRCLQSLQQLNFNSFEVIVVDNGSSDFRIPDINRQFPLRYFTQPVKGISFARNSVLPYCRGDFIALIDDDAIAHPDWLLFATKWFSDRDVACVTGKILPIQMQTEWQQKYFDQGWLPCWDESKCFRPENYDPFNTPAGAGTNIILRKSVLEQCKFAEFFGAGTPVGAEDDHYLVYRIMELGSTLIYDPASIVYHPYPQTEEEYAYLVQRSISSRYSYILRFLFSESGYRLHAFRYILRKTFIPKTRRLAVDTRIRTGGFLKGAAALMRSLSYARKYHSTASQSLKEIVPAEK